MSIDAVLTKVADNIKDINVANGPEDRVWAHPFEANAIKLNNFPFVIVSKMNADPGSWGTASYGVGEHSWRVLIAVYLSEGPIVVSNSDKMTIKAMADANDWYEAMAEMLFDNLTLNGTVKRLGNDNGSLFEYVTDNILWDGTQYYGHLFIISVTQEIIQDVSS